MQIIVVNTCDCGNENCNHSEPVILCVCASDKDDKALLESIVNRFEAEGIYFPPKMTQKIWNEIEDQIRIFTAGKDLINKMYG